MGTEIKRMATDHKRVFLGHTSDQWFLIVTLLVLAVISAMALWAAQHAHNTADDAARLAITVEKHRLHDEVQDHLIDHALQKAIDDNRGATYRICVRQMRVRIAINQDQFRDEPKLPLYDCTPNLVGKPAKRLNAAQSRALTRKYRSLP
jgi:hypothetical protein